MRSSSLSAAERLGRSLIRGLRLELCLTPKPGLVDLRDSGSHPDLTFAGMAASIGLVGDYLNEILEALAADARLVQLIMLGRRAESRMWNELGTNTHKGAIFLGGLILAARVRTVTDDPAELRPAIAALSREFFNNHSPVGTNGDRVRRDFAVGGIVGEALCGLPSLFEVALPAYRTALARRASPRLASFWMMARLMQTVEDTTALHRYGPRGLERLYADGLRLERILAAGADPMPLLGELNEEYRRLRLTMGGVADFLGIAFGWLAYLGLPLGNGAKEELPEHSLFPAAPAGFP